MEIKAAALPPPIATAAAIADAAAPPLQSSLRMFVPSSGIPRIRRLPNYMNRRLPNCPSPRCGREAGLWLRDNVPSGAVLMTIGPSMANILQFYGRHEALALSVSPTHRANPSNRPVNNPDLAVRSGEIQYLIWDSYTAARTPFFAGKLQALVERYCGVMVFRYPWASLPRDRTVADRDRLPEYRAMTRARRRITAAVGILLILTAIITPSAHGETLSSGPASSPLIQHFVFMMQGDRTFDNYFGVFPGADGVLPTSVRHT